MYHTAESSSDTAKIKERSRENQEKHAEPDLGCTLQLQEDLWTRI